MCWNHRMTATCSYFGLLALTFPFTQRCSEITAVLRATFAPTNCQSSVLHASRTCVYWIVLTARDLRNSRHDTIKKRRVLWNTKFIKYMYNVLTMGTDQKLNVECWISSRAGSVLLFLSCPFSRLSICVVLQEIDPRFIAHRPNTRIALGSMHAGPDYSSIGYAT
jgi:hypothetical protein